MDVILRLFSVAGVFVSFGEGVYRKQINSQSMLSLQSGVVSVVIRIFLLQATVKKKKHIVMAPTPPFWARTRSCEKPA